MNTHKNNNILSIMETPPMRIKLCIDDHPIDETDPIINMKKTVGEMENIVKSILKRAGARK